MSEAAMGRGRWAIAGATATVVMATVVFLFRFPSAPIGLAPSRSTPNATPSSVKLAKPSESDRLLQDETQLRDLRPLFLPTERNVSLPEPRREPGRTFLDDENVDVRFPEAELNLASQLPPVVTLNGKPMADATVVDALAPDAIAPALGGFGRRPAEVVPLPARGGFVEIVATRDGRRVLAQALPVEAKPAGDKPWEPVEFIVTIDAAGLAAPLVVTASSRVEEVDAYFRNYLARTFRVGERLAPGFYRITVAP